MTKDRKRILFVKNKLTIPRYHFNRTLELSNEFDIIYIINSARHSFSLDEFSRENHKIIFLNKPVVKGLINTTISIVKYYLFVFKYLKDNSFDLINIDNSRLCFLLPLLKRNNNFVLQMYTSTVTNSRIRNIIFDLEKKFNTLFFKRIIVGTEWMITKFNLTNKETHIVKWGTKPLSLKYKTFNSIRLLYLGTLNNREIYKTVEGLSLFLEANKGFDISYDIVGAGYGYETQRLVEIIKTKKLEGIVNYHGFIEDEQLPKFFDKCNIGVAYLPVRDYYNNVVTTKLYEYCISGLFSIATNTVENRKIINSINGVLIDESAKGFADGLNFIKEHLDEISSDQIIKDSKHYTLSYNTKRFIIPIYNKLTNIKN